MTQLLDVARARNEEWIEGIGALVDIDSGPGDTDGIGAVYSFLEGWLDRLGFTSGRVRTNGPDVLVARRPSPRRDQPRVALIGHADTVFGKGAAAARPFTVDGDRLTGPGVADMKAGLVVATAALELAGADTLDLLDLTMVVNGDEESGSADSSETIVELADDLDAAFVFEPGRPPNEVVSARRGARRFDVLVTGRSAHSGVNPQDGANAIEAVAQHVLAIQELGRSVSHATVNVTMIDGGSRPNIVPDRAVARVDARFDDDGTESLVVEGIMALEGAGPVEGTATEVRSLDRRPAFRAASSGLSERYMKIADGMGLTVTSAPTGGSSDGNFTSAQGVQTLDGLGAVGAGFHTDDEYVLADSVPERAALFTHLLSDLADGGLRR